MQVLFDKVNYTYKFPGRERTLNSCLYPKFLFCFEFSIIDLGAKMIVDLPFHKKTKANVKFVIKAKLVTYFKT